ncbi:MAG: HEPN domain-containing protein [Endomicrobia bacterium]|nr:HEPN domain-containing protein [Endomicrobiia bacterium]
MKNKIKEWLMIADKDIISAQILMTHGHDVMGDAAFHCQQAIEKYFKAYLLENNWQLEKTHNLTKLYGEILNIKDLGVDAKILKQIDDVYVDTRYPDDYSEPTEEEIKRFYNFAKEIEVKIKKELGAG